MSKLTWNVFRENFNAKKIEIYDIFKRNLRGDKSYFEKIAIDLKNKYPNKEQWAEEFRKTLMYYFGSKAEHEIILTSWPPYIEVEDIAKLQKEVDKHEKEWGYKQYRVNITPTVAEKIDIYEQLLLNWDVFIDYVWSNI